MTEADTRPNDFMIARHMGYNYPDKDNAVFTASHDSLHNYSQSWELLMPVVLSLLSQFATTCILEHPLYISLNNQWWFSLGDDTIYGAYCGGNIPLDAVYNTVVQFLQHYNDKQ